LDDSTDNERPPSSSEWNPTLPLPTSDRRTLVRAAEQAPHVGEFQYRAADSTSYWPQHPVLEIALLNADGELVLSTYAKIDTGADITTLDAEWAAPLGIDLKRDCQLVPVGAATETPVYHHCYADGLTITVVGEPLFLPLVMFCERKGIALLGRRDFLKRYVTLVDEPSRRFFLERVPDPVEDEDDDDQLDLALAG
jgi:hypothetical protein